MRPTNVSGWRVAVIDDDLACVSADTAVPVPERLVIGRGQPPGALGHIAQKYASREHIIVVRSTSEDQSKLTMMQVGKNPTFVGPSAASLSAGAKLELEANGNGKLPDAAMALTSRTRLDGTVFFPKSLGLPTYHFFFIPHVPPRGARDMEPLDRQKSMKEILNTLPVDNLEEEEDEHHRRHDKSDSDAPSPPLRRKGISVLDQAMREQAQRNAVAMTDAAAMARYVAPAPPLLLPPQPKALLPSEPSAAKGTGGWLFPKATPLPKVDIGHIQKASPAPPPEAAAPPPKPTLRLDATTVEDDDDDEFILAKPKTKTKEAARNGPPARAAVALPAAGSPAVWEWKARANGDDNDPRSWKAYSPAECASLEADYTRDGGKLNVSQLNGSYSVCFTDRDVGMIQFRNDDKSKWRAVRRRGGPIVERPRAKRIRCVVPSSSSSESSRFGSGDDYDRKDSFINDDDDDDDSEDDDDDSSFEFDSESSAVTDSDDSDNRKRRKAKKNKKKQPAKKPKKEAK